MKNSRIVTLATFAMVVFGGVETAFASMLYSFTTIDVPGASCCTTVANGINDSGQIVGWFEGPGEGAFLATPVATPEPSSSLTLAPCLVALCAMACRRKRASAGNLPGLQ